MTEGHESIIRRIANSDPQAFRELFNRWSPKVLGFSLKITRSESIAEEIVQDVFERIWQRRKGLESVDNFPAYLFTITRNHALNILKRLAAEEKAKMILADDLRRIQPETEELTIGHDYKGLLNQAIDCLPPQQKLVYNLCHREGMKYSEVAEKLRISHLTVKTHMQHALRSIRSRLAIVAKTMILLLLPGLN